MNTTPLISIVLPTYNGVRYLEESVRSCRAQTYTNWELIIVDDCSTDATPELITRLVARDKRIRSIRHEQNRKLPASLNTGFAQARGEYLTWTSDDNAYRPPALATMVAFLQEHPDIAAVYADYTMVDSDGTPTRRKTVRDPDDLVNGNCCGACFLYRRTVQETLGGYAEDLFLAEDYDFWLRASIKFRLQPLHEDLYLYRTHGASLTDAQGERVRWAVEKTLIRHLPQLNWLSGRQRAGGYLKLFRSAHARGDMAMARRYFWQACRCSWLTALRNGEPGMIANALFGRTLMDGLRAVK